MRRAMTFCLAILTCLALSAGTAWAGGGDALMTEVDDLMNSAEDETFVFSARTLEKGKSPRLVVLKVWIKDGMRLTEFLEPGDLKGMKALTLSASQIYTYLPEYKKVRRVASHTSERGFMGMAYGQAEMALSRYSAVYAASTKSEDDTSWTLALTPKEGATAPYPKMELVISKKVKRPTELRYFNASGTLAKTETRSDFKCKGKLCNAGTMRMVDHTKDGLETTFTMSDWEVNSGLSKRKFSVRSLQGRR
jgi:outer membrane lipoprotein-sorting protein